MPMEWERAKNDVTYYTHDITGDPLPTILAAAGAVVLGVWLCRRLRKRK